MSVYAAAAQVLSLILHFNERHGIPLPQTWLAAWSELPDCRLQAALQVIRHDFAASELASGWLVRSVTDAERFIVSNGRLGSPWTRPFPAYS